MAVIDAPPRISGRAFGYIAAATMVPYLVIKVAWVIGALLGFLPAYAGMGLVPFVVLNLVTIGLSAVAIGVALALVRPWGERIRAVPLLGAAWIGAGFLVPMLPFMVVTTLLHGVGGDGPPAWEGALIEASFIGWAVGFAVAMPFYLRSRWPSAFTRARVGAAPVLVILAVALGALSLYWTLGGTAGIAHPGLRDLDWRLMAGNTALWAFVAAWAGWALGRPTPGWLPGAATWVASGFLFAWSAWKLPFTLYLAFAAPVWPEQLGVAAAQYVLSVVTGLLLLRTVLTSRP